MGSQKLPFNLNIFFILILTAMIWLPINLQAGNVTTPAWKLSPFAEYYEIQAARDKDFSIEVQEFKIDIPSSKKAEVAQTGAGVAMSTSISLDAGQWFIRIRGVGDIMAGAYSNPKMITVDTPRIYGNIMLANYYMYLASNYYFTSNNPEEAYRFYQLAIKYSPSYYPRTFQSGFQNVIMKDPTTNQQVEFKLVHPNSFVLDRTITKIKNNYLSNIQWEMSTGDFYQALILAKQVVRLDPFDPRVDRLAQVFLLNVDPVALAREIPEGEQFTDTHYEMIKRTVRTN